MKQLGNLAMVCAQRPEVLMMLYGGEAVVYVFDGSARTVMDCAWDNDAEISRIVHELNFGRYAPQKTNLPLGGSAKMVQKEIATQEEAWSGLITNPHLYSTVHASLIDMETDEPIEALYDYAGQYQEVISQSMDVFQTQDYPSNDLMQYFHLPDDPMMEWAIRQKIQSAHITVESSGPRLYARLDLRMAADLTRNELYAFTNQIESQYRDGWGAEFELQVIPIKGEGIVLRLWNDDISFFTAAEKSSFEQRFHQQCTEEIADG